MYRAEDVRPERCVNRPVARDARQRGQTGRAYHDGEMRLTRPVVPCMTGMPVAFVHHLKPIRRKSRLKPVTNSVFHRHFAVNPLQSLLL